MKSFKESGKKHLLITGSKKSGKTTMLKEILKDMECQSEKYLVGGIITYTIRDEYHMPKYVVLSDLNNPDLSGLIAKRNLEATALIPCSETFESLGVNILKRYNQSNVEVIAIDEIGFLESNCVQYQDEIIKCFHKSVICVIRKELNTFTKRLIDNEDAFLINLDNLNAK